MSHPSPLQLLTSHPSPLQLGAPPPPSVTLDLSGCIGCVNLTGHARVYLTNLHLTGLEQPGHGPGPSSSSSRSGGGSQLGNTTSHLPLALWAFQFNRSSGVPSVILYNVTLTLPQVLPPLHSVPHSLKAAPGTAPLHPTYTSHPKGCVLHR